MYRKSVKNQTRMLLYFSCDFIYMLYLHAIFAKRFFLLSNRISRMVQQQSSREYFQELNQIKACPHVVPRRGFYEIFLRRNVIMFLHTERTHSRTMFSGIRVDLCCPKVIETVGHEEDRRNRQTNSGCPHKSRVFNLAARRRGTECVFVTFERVVLN